MKKLDKIWIGVVVGLIAPIVVLYAIFQMGNFMEDLTDFSAFFFNLKYTIVLFKPCLLINLAFFMLFINKDYLMFCRGIVFSTMAYILAIVSSYFF